jgi:hypothetical protein
MEVIGGLDILIGAGRIDRMSTDGPGILLSYRTAGSQPGRVLSVPAAVGSGIVVGAVLLIALYLIPSTWEILRDLGTGDFAPPPWLLRGVGWLKFRHRWVLLLALPVVFAFVAPHLHRGNPGRQRWSFAATGFLTLAMMLALFLLTAGASFWPVVSFHRAIAHPPRNARGQLHFPNKRVLCAYIALRQDSFSSLNVTGLELSIPATPQLRLNGQPTFYLIERPFDDAGENGSYFVAVAGSDGFDLVGEMRGDHPKYTEDPPGFSIRWHASAAGGPTTEYRWNGSEFVEGYSYDLIVEDGVEKRVNSSRGAPEK